MTDRASYYSYWGKSGLNPRNELIWHQLVYHCLDVAAVGDCYLDSSPAFARSLAHTLGIDDSLVRKSVCFFLSLHDVGKFSERFQNLQPNLFRQLRGDESNASYSGSHVDPGLLLWDMRLHKDICLSIFKDATNEIPDAKDILDIWIETVLGHHGRPARKHRPDNIDWYFSNHDLVAVKQFVESLTNLFLCESRIHLSYQLLKDSLTRLSWLLAGMCVVCDWIGSDRKFFDFVAEPMPLKEYWESLALPQARAALEDSGILPTPVSAETGMNVLFPEILQPTPLQKYVETCPLAEGAQLFVIEEATGSGKTEAALVLAHRMMNAGLADGVYFALPTMATADAMYLRLADSYRRFYSDRDRPSLVLSHSARDLSDAFTESILHINGPNNRFHGENAEAASAQCVAWIADHRKKALLADVGVGTVDQALLGVLPSTHQALRLLGLSRKVLVVDEPRPRRCG